MGYLARPRAKYQGTLVIEPDNAGALVDLGGLPKEVAGNLKTGDVIELKVKRMPILQYKTVDVGSMYPEVENVEKL